MNHPESLVTPEGQSKSPEPWQELVTHLDAKRLAECEPRALLVDSRVHNYAALEGIADTLGIVVDHATCAAQALHYCRHATYEAVLIDPEDPHWAIGACALQLVTIQPHASLIVVGDLHTAPRQLTSCSNLLGSLRKPWEPEAAQALLRCALDSSHERREAAAHGSGQEGHRMHVLVLGDRSGSTPIGCQLESRGVLVSVSNTLAEGLRKAEQTHFDAVVTCLALPDACGIDALVALRSAVSNVPVVAILDEDNPPLTALAFQVGAQEVLSASGLEGDWLVRAVSHAVFRQRSLADISFRALHDELTNLAKRTVLYQRVSNALARSRRLGNTFALIYIDLDRFKVINDAYGHDVGDAVLVTVAGRLLGAVREYDTVARLGGDEFAILLDTLEEPGEAECVAQRVLASVSKPIEAGGHHLDVTASMGISVFPRGGSGVDDLLRNADQAMYCAKRSGRNTYSLSPLTRESAAQLPAHRRTSIRAPLMRCP